MRRGGGGSRAVRFAAAAAAAVLVLLVLAQLLLPRIAGQRISSKVGRYGHVQSVSVSAWPAVKLLWGDADSITVHAGPLRLSPAQAASLLWEGRGASRIDVTASSVQLGSLALANAALHKHGSALSAAATTTQAQAQAALPPGVTVRLLRSTSQGVVVLAGGGLFGIGLAVQALAQASHGQLVVHPLAPLLGGLRLTLFSDPHVYLLGVGARVVSRAPLTYALALHARLR